MTSAASTPGNTTVPVRPQPQTWYQKLWKQRYLQLMVLPGVIWMAIFNYMPMYGILIAFKNFRITKTVWEAPWVGFEHFQDFFADQYFGSVLGNTLAISVLKLVINFPMPIIFAILLNELRSVRYKRVVQTVSYLPHFLSWVVLGGILINWLNETGMVNDLLLKAGILNQSVSFLAEPKYFWGVVVVSDLWKELGWSAIIYLAAITSIDQAMYEAATVDGATKFQKIIHITLPSIRGTIAILFILAVSRMMDSNFNQIFMLRNVLNVSRSEVLDTYVYQMGIRVGRYSYATAIGLFKSIIALILLTSANSVTKKLQGSALF